MSAYNPKTSIIEYIAILPKYPKLFKAILATIAVVVLAIVALAFCMIYFYICLSHLQTPGDTQQSDVEKELATSDKEMKVIQIADYEGIQSIQSQFAESHLIERNERYDLADYDQDGFPTGRMWLSAAEFKGDHIADDNTKSRFKKRKKRLMASFVALLLPRAKQIAKEHGVPYRVILAQAILESAYGTSRVAVTGSNLFGHKLTPAERRKYEENGTAGFTKDVAGFIPANDDDNKDQFRQYVSIWAGMKRHAELLVTYKKTNGGDFPECLCGSRNYASNCAGSYAEKIKKTMSLIP